MACHCKCSPLQAKNGFYIGNSSDPLTTYSEWKSFTPIVNGLVNNFGSQYKKIGDQVFVNINIIFTAQTTANNFIISGLPFPIAANTLPSNGISLQSNFTTPIQIIEAKLNTNIIDLSSLVLTSVDPFILNVPYTLNGQFVYSCKI